MLANAYYVLIAVSSHHRASALRHAVSEYQLMETVLVRNGDDALQEVGRRGLPTLLLIDLSLPRVDGFAVIRKLRRQSSASETRIIAIAAHEALRRAARELAEPLGISAILSLDVDHDALTVALSTALAGVRGVARHADPAPAPASRTISGPAVAEAVDRAAIEARRRCGLPISVAFLSIDGEDHLTFQVSTRDSVAPTGIGELSAFAFLREVADAADPLVIPDIEGHPVFGPLLHAGARPVRGLVAVPIPIAQPGHRAALSVLDTKPLTLAAADVDALAVYGREAGRDIDAAMAAHEEGDRAGARLRGVAQVSMEEVEALQHMASTDPLTGLANRRGGEKHIGNEISRAKRERRLLSCILLDIDSFKQVNDTFGHQAGDQLLRDVSALLRRTVRAYDILVRWGGEEFLLVLPGVGLGVAQALAERVRVAIEALDTQGIGTVTISAGVAVFESDYDFAATLRTADRRLYQAKAGGRNRIV